MEKAAGNCGDSMRPRSYIALAMIAVIALLNCSREQPPGVDNALKTEDLPDQEGWNSVVAATNNGRLKAKVTYGHMLRFSKDKVAKFDQGIKVVFFDETGKKTSTLTAERGILNEKTNDVSAMGNVVVVSDTGVTLHTEELSFDQRKQKIISRVDVMVTTMTGDTLYGIGFESDAQLHHWRIIKPRGTAHRGVDLSLDQLKKSSADTVAATPEDAAVPDNATLRDSTLLPGPAIKDTLKANPDSS